MDLLKLKEAIELVEKYTDCQDNSCYFKKSNGMRTNGGCRCKDKPFAFAALAKLYKTVKEFINEETNSSSKASDSSNTK